MPIKDSGQLSLSELAEEYRQPLNNVSLGGIAQTSGLSKLNEPLAVSNLYEYTHPLRGRNQDASINGIGIDPEPFGESTFFRDIGTLQILGEFTQNTVGIVFEQGGQGVGFALYFHNGVLYSTAGDGSIQTGTVELSYAPQPGEVIYEIITSFVMTSGQTKAVLFVNGELKDYSYDFLNSDNREIAGTDPGGTGKIYSVLRIIRGSGVAISNGTIERANLFADYFVFPVSVGVSPSYTQNETEDTSANGHVNQQQIYAVEAYGFFDTQSHGVVYESGGTTYGTTIYFYENQIYAQVGQSDFTDPNLTNVTSFISIPTSYINKPIYHIAYTSKVTAPTRSELYINYRLVSFDVSHSTTLYVGGSDPAAFGQENTSMAESLLDRSANTKGKTLQDAHFTTGLVYNSNRRLQSPVFEKTPTLILTGSTSSGTHMNNAQQAIVEGFGKWDFEDDGIFFETGADGIGSVIYLYEGIMYFQSGDGSVAGGDIELSYNLAENKETAYSYMISIDYDTNEAFLYVNGFLVDSNTTWTSDNDFSGSNEGGVGKIYEFVSITQGSNNRDQWNTPGNPTGTFTGTITKTYLYNNTSI